MKELPEADFVLKKLCVIGLEDLILSHQDQKGTMYDLADEIMHFSEANIKTWGNRYFNVCTEKAG
jgi:hypothetical protein